MPTNILHKQYIDNPLLFKEGAGSGLIPAPTTPQPPPCKGGGVRQRWLTMATDSVDRAGDMLLLAGMDATNFLNNPQFLWQHGTSGSLVNTIGRVLDLRVVDSSPSRLREGLGEGVSVLQALVEYADGELSPLAEQVYQMEMAGLLPANSIGFRPIEYEANEFGGYTFTKWELIECSKVELPMNPEAIDSIRRDVLRTSGLRAPEVFEDVAQFPARERAQHVPTAESAAEWLVS